MKIKIIIASLLALSILIMPSCNDSFMQQDPIDDMAEETYFTKEEDLPLYLDGLYRYYIYGHGIGGTNNDAHDKGFLAVKAGSQIIFGDAYSDNVVYAGNPDGKIAGTYDTPANAPGVTTLNAPWTWFKLKKVNYFLRNYTKVGPAENLKKWAAEAYFFKAWDYYIKLVALGEVPWLEEDLNIDSPELYSARTPRPELVDNIMKCLDFAIQNLEDTSKPANRVNKNMALFLKARFCLFEGTFRKYHTELGLESTANFYLQASRDASKAIIDQTDKYQLYKDDKIKNSYWKLFTLKQVPEADGNKEDILARVYNGTKLGHDNPRYVGFNNHTRYSMGATVAMTEDYLCINGEPIYTGGSKGNYQKNPLFKGYDGLWEELDNRDPRLTQTVNKPGEYASVFDYAKNTYGIEETGIIYPMVIHQTGGGTPVKMYNSTVTGYRFIKHWMPDKAEWDANANGKQTAHMFRLAEAMLIYAEARAELNEITNEDLDLTVNKLRERAGFDFVKYPKSRLTLQTIPSDPRLDNIYAEKLDYSVSPILREIRRERRVELMLEGFRYEDLMRWKAGKLFTVPVRGMKMTPEKIALYDGRIDKVNPKTGYKETAYPNIQIGNDVVVDSENFIVPWPNSPTIVNGNMPWNDRRYYYPIPLKELQLNPKLVQNPGWKDISR